MTWKAYDAGLIKSPIWSGTIGFPMFHHYIWGFIGVVVFYILLFRKDFIYLEVKLLDVKEEWLKKLMKETNHSG